jgi:hypothetical protein
MHRIIYTVFALFYFNFGSTTNTNNRNTTSKLS